jgi:hypothetical protein
MAAALFAIAGDAEGSKSARSRLPFTKRPAREAVASLKKRLVAKPYRPVLLSCGPPTGRICC